MLTAHTMFSSLNITCHNQYVAYYPGYFCIPYTKKFQKKKKNARGEHTRIQSLLAYELFIN